MSHASNPETLAAVLAVAGGLARRAEEIESDRRLPDDLVKELVEAGAMRMLVPARFGGSALGLPAALRVIEALARADASTGWTVGQITLGQIVLDSFPEAAREAVYASGPDTIVAGAVAPKGRVSEVDGRWRVSGQWPFVSGCWYASWAYMTCVELSGHAVRTGADGAPMTRMVLLPARELQVVDTWQVLGLRGTASHDVRVSGAQCPLAHSFSMAGDTPRAALTRYRIAQAGLLIAAVNVGLARGALDDVVALATDGKRPAFSRRRLADSPVFQDRLGEATLTCRAARALLYAEAERAQRHTEAVTAGIADGIGEVPGPAERTGLRAAAARIASLTGTVVDTAHQLGGGSAVYASSPLQRRVRDMHTSSQHFVNGRDYYGVLGALMAGADVDPALP